MPDFPLTGSQGHANADFAAPLIHGIGHDSVQPDRGKGQSQESEYGEKVHGDFAPPKGLVDDFRAGADIFHGKARIDAMNLVANGSKNGAGILLGSYVKDNGVREILEHQTEE